MVGLYHCLAATLLWLAAADPRVLAKGKKEKKSKSKKSKKNDDKLEEELAQCQADLHYALKELDQCQYTTEYVAFGPNANTGDPSDYDTPDTAPLLKWYELKYPKDMSATSIDEVSLSLVEEPFPDLIGAWGNLDLAAGMAIGLTLSGKVFEDIFYALVQVNRNSTGETGCCADTLRMYPRDGGGSYTDIPVKPLLDALFPEPDITNPYPTHTLDVTRDADGIVYAYIVLSSFDPDIEGVAVTSYIAINTVTGSFKPTADGDSIFYNPAQVGTLSTVKSDSIFKQQYYFPVNSSGVEEWHGNGILRFVDRAGLHLFGYTEFDAHNLVIMKDPYVYTQAQGGGQILQRFGTPPYWPANPVSDPNSPTEYHRFGVAQDAPAWEGGCHNVWYTESSTTSGLEGKQTITVWNNYNTADTTRSNSFEFELKLVEQQAGVTYDDTVFETTYVELPLHMFALTEGASRPIGNGVYFVGSGFQFVNGAFVGNDIFQLIDMAGNTKNVSYSESFPYPHDVGGAYDTFIRVVVD